MAYFIKHVLTMRAWVQNLPYLFNAAKNSLALVVLDLFLNPYIARVETIDADHRNRSL